MDIGQRLRELREAKGISQGHIEKRTGVLRSHISRIECGHKPPSFVTLEKWAKALDLELYQIFYEGKGQPVAPEASRRMALDRREVKLVHLFREMPEEDKSLLLGLAREAFKQRGKHE